MGNMNIIAHTDLKMKRVKGEHKMSTFLSLKYQNIPP